MKKIIGLFLVAAIAAAIAGCGSQTEGDTTVPATGTTGTVGTKPPAATTTAPPSTTPAAAPAPGGKMTGKTTG